MSLLKVDTVQGRSGTDISVASGHTLKDSSGDAFITNSGLTLVHSSTFSSVSAKSVDNCFSSTYRHYKLNIQTKNSETADIHFRFRDGSGDNTDSEYWWKYLYTTSSNNWTAYANGGNTNYAELISGGGTAQSYNYTLDIYNPQAADYTSFNMHGSWKTGGILINGGGYDEQDQFTGISIYPESGTFTSGILQIYGYAQ